VHSPYPVQTFPVAPDIVQLGLYTGEVVVRIASNWGAGYTCVYRVR
jgi:SUN domain-containing protein 1/2